MTVEAQTVKKFLENKPGYLKCGPKRISDATGVKDLDLIRKIKKQVIKGNKKVKINPIAEITPELVKQFLEFAATNQAAFNGAINVPGTATLLKIKPQKVQKKVFDTDGIHFLMGCNHVPMHNQRMHHGMRELIKDLGEKMVGFHILGDFLDINSLSSHDRGKFTSVRGLTLEQEYVDGREELRRFEKVLPKTVKDKSFIYGNHEDRVHRFNSDMQNAKNPAILPHDALKLEDMGYNVHTKWSQDFCTIGNLDIFHGIYFNIHNAKKHLDTFNRNCAYVHTHRMQMYREGDLAAHNIGACADFAHSAFNYASRAMKQSWANGFALATVVNGRTHVTQIEVINGEFVYNGKVY